MTELQLRKQTLLLESDLNRLTLHAQCAHLREAVNWVGRLEHVRRQIAPWALALSALAGLAFTLRPRRTAAGRGLWAWVLERAAVLIPLVSRTFSSCRTNDQNINSQK
jgi:hypothetical protein